MRLRDRLEFSAEENKEYDLFEKLFPDYLEITLGNNCKQIRLLYSQEKLESIRANISILDKKIYTLIAENIIDADTVELHFERTYSLKRANKMGILIIKKYDELNYFFKHSRNS